MNTRSARTSVQPPVSRRRIPFVASLVACSLAAQLVAGADPLEVPGGHTSIADALAAATPGQTINVAGGEHYAGTLTVAAGPVTLVAVPGPLVDDATLYSTCGCSIDDACHAAGTVNPADPCQYCWPSRSFDNWTTLAGGECVTGGVWSSAVRPLPVTPYGHRPAIVCHNCYKGGSGGYDATTTMIDNAIAGQADAIELDVQWEDSEVIVEHLLVDGPPLLDVLEYLVAAEPDQILMIENKEDSAGFSGNYIETFLDELLISRYPAPGRPVVLRASNSNTFPCAFRDFVSGAKALLDSEPKYAPIREYIRFHVMFNIAGACLGFDNPSVEQIDRAEDDGFHGVEFPIDQGELFRHMTYARSRGLATGLFGISNDDSPEVFVAAFREEADVLIVDEQDAAKLTQAMLDAREIAMENNGLAYLNVWDQEGSGHEITYYKSNVSDPATLTVGLPGDGRAEAPVLVEWNLNWPMFGGVLDFDPAGDQHLRLYDADNNIDGGYLVTAVVKFDDLTLDGNDQMILAKSDSSGFFLKLDSTGIDELEYGAWVNGAYERAKETLGLNLNGSDSFFLIGAYDGDGDVRLWINASDLGVSTSAASGEVARNNVPVVIGADPQGSPVGCQQGPCTVSTRDHFNGKIQQISVLAWDDSHAPCAHDLCVEGVLLDPACDPCANRICLNDNTCCLVGWDSTCVLAVDVICGQSCP